MRALTTIAVGGLCSLALGAPLLAAADDVFLVLPGLDGESVDDQFAGAFDGRSVTSGVSPAESGTPTFSPVIVELRGTSAGTLGLEEAAATGRAFPQAVVSVRRAGESRFVYLTYTLTDVVVSSFQRASGDASDAPTGAVALTYGRIQTDYRRQNPDGTAGPVVSLCWDVKRNARCQ